jgi:DNA-binding phage protein
LRSAIKASGLTHYALAKEAGVQASQIDRFMMPADDPRHRDMRLSTAAKVAAVLGLDLVAGG